MEHQNPQEESTEWLMEQFDRVFDRYCTQLRFGTPTKMFTEDTPDNRLLMEEFRDNYLPQRANFEGWKYKPESFQIVYVSEADKFTHNPTIFYDPREKNLGFEEVDSRSGYLKRLQQQEANRRRNNLQAILDRKSQE